MIALEKTMHNGRGLVLVAIVGLAASAFGQPAETVQEAPIAPPLLAEPPKDSVTAPKPAEAKADPAPSLNQDPEAKAAFDQFVEAMKTINSLSFEVSFAVDGNGKEMFGTTTAKIIARRTETGWAYRMTGKGKRTAKADDVEFDVLYAEGNASWLDKDAKKLYVRPTATARGKPLEAASNLRTLSDLFVASPLAKERVSPTMTLRDAEKVGSVDCIVAAVTGAPGTMSGDSIFAFGKDDHIPRRITRERSSSKGTTSMVLEFSNLKVDDKFTDADFTLTLPDGFTKDEQQSPKAASATPPARVPDKAAPIAPPKSITDAGEVLTPPTGPGAETGVPVATPVVGPDGLVTPPGTQPGQIVPAQPSIVNPVPSPNSPASPVPTNDAGPMQAFEAKTLDGKTVTLDSIKGQPTVVLFFGSWSLSSKKALPELKDLATRYKGKANIYAAAVRQRDSQAAGKMVADAGLDVPVIIDADKLADQWHVGAYPALFVLGADGEILKKPETSKLIDMFSAAKAALDNALGMTPEAAPAAETEPDLPLPGEAGSGGDQQPSK
jgi:thiol-disulfide isomerase/thioredoxin